MTDVPDALDARDAIDPELVNLRKARPRSAVVAIAILVLTVALFMRLKADLMYAIAPHTPVDLGDARALTGELKDNQFVMLSGLPDRRHALSVDIKGELTRQTIFRLPSNGAELFVRTMQNNANPDPQNHWVGRLRRASTQPYTAALHQAFAGMAARRYLQVNALRDALRQKSAVVADRVGEKIRLTPASELRLNYPHEDQLEVAMSAEQFATIGDAQHELEQIGLVVKSGEKRGRNYSVVIDFPADKHEAILNLLERSDLTYRMHYEYVTKKLADLSADDDKIWQGLSAVSIAEPIEVGDDAFVLTEGETPQKYLWAPLLMLVVIFFAGVNALYLVRRMRPSA